MWKKSIVREPWPSHASLLLDEQGGLFGIFGAARVLHAPCKHGVWVGEARLLLKRLPPPWLTIEPECTGVTEIFLKKWFHCRGQAWLTSLLLMTIPFSAIFF